MREDISIHTPDGDCRAFVFTPGDGRSHPAILFYMDGAGIRPALLGMGERMASHGYVVLLADMYYRGGVYQPFDVARLMAEGSLRQAIAPYSSTVNNAIVAQDTKALLAYLDSRDDVSGPGILAVGYCMGGGWALTAAARFPDRIVAAASFHGGRLADDSPMSPHLLVSQIKGEIYVAGAQHDASYPPEMAGRLEQALRAAGVDHRCEIYEGAQHAWTMTDDPRYDAVQAERHWTELLALAQRKLQPF